METSREGRDQGSVRRFQLARYLSDSGRRMRFETARNDWGF